MIDPSRKWRVLLSDIRLDKSFKFENDTVILNEGTRKKYTCYTCLEKFRTAFELHKHKQIEEVNDEPATKKKTLKAPKVKRRSRLRKCFLEYVNVETSENFNDLSSISSESSLEFTFNDSIDDDSDTEFREENLISPTTGLCSDRLSDDSDREQLPEAPDEVSPTHSVTEITVKEEEDSHPHEARITVTTNFKCIACDINFRTLGEMILHVIKIVPFCLFGCSACNKNMSRLDLLKDMSQHELSYNFFECTFCYESFFTYEALQDHLVQAHKFSPCKTDPENFIRASCANYQEKENAFTFKCRTCSFLSMKSEELERHMCQSYSTYSASEAQSNNFLGTAHELLINSMESNSETVSVNTDDIREEFNVLEEKFETTNSSINMIETNLSETPTLRYGFKTEINQEYSSNELGTETTRTLLDQNIVESQILPGIPQSMNNNELSANRINELMFESMHALKNIQSVATDNIVDENTVDNEFRLIGVQICDYNDLKMRESIKQLQLLTEPQNTETRGNVSRIIPIKSTTKDDQLFLKLQEPGTNEVYSSSSSLARTPTKILYLLNKNNSANVTSSSDNNIATPGSIAASATDPDACDTSGVTNIIYEPRKMTMSLTDDSDFLEQINIHTKPKLSFPTIH